MLPRITQWPEDRKLGVFLDTSGLKQMYPLFEICSNTEKLALYNKIKEGDIKCGMGPVLSLAPSLQNNVLKMLVD